MATLASKPYCFLGSFYPVGVLPALCWSSYKGCHCALDIQSYSSLEYYFNSIFPLKVPQTVLFFCLLVDLAWAIEATSTLDVGYCLSLYWVSKSATASKSLYTYCGDCCGQLFTPNAIQQMSNFDPGSRPRCPYSIKFPRMRWYLAWWAIYFSHFHAFFSPSYVDVCNAYLTFDAVMLTWFGPSHVQWMA